MMREDDEDDFEDGEEAGGDGAAMTLAQELEERYTGDPRFELVELAEPGQLEGERFRLKLIHDEHAHFFAAAIPDECIVRVGLCTDNRWASEGIEQAILDSGDSMTEFLEDAMDSNEELEHEVQHFHDDAFYFCSDIPYDTEIQLASEDFRELVTYYLDGYADALSEFLEEDEEDGDED